MSGLPKQIPPQGEPIGMSGGEPITLDLNWYLWLYNLSTQVFGTAGSSPATPSTQVATLDSEADSADIPQAYRQLENIAAVESQDMELVSADLQRVQRDVFNTRVVESLGEDLGGVDVAGIARRLADIESLLQTLDGGPSLRDLANAILLATDALLPDPPPAAGAVIPITPGSSPFTYTAIHDGTMFISGSVSSTIALSRYGVNVPLGMSDGTIPLRANDQLMLTWSGGTPPTLNYLPNR